MQYTENPIADYDAHLSEEQRRLEKLPKCYECGEPIQTEECYEFNDEIICPGCLNDNHRKWVDDIV